MNAGTIALAGLALAGSALGVALLRAPVRPLQDLAVYATDVGERTRAQRHNAALAAARLDGATLGPGATLSFNRRVGSWDSGAGYRRAPVSYGGTLVLAVGGGVCQTSTTLYNAALLSGLRIVERHPHTVAPSYVPAGRDAAVAFPGIDLRVQNPYPWPVSLRARIDGERLVVRVQAAQRPSESFAVRSERLAWSAPGRRGWSVPGRTRKVRGIAGGRVRTWRVRLRAGQEAGRERLGDDTYLGRDRLIGIGV